MTCIQDVRHIFSITGGTSTHILTTEGFGYEENVWCNRSGKFCLAESARFWMDRQPWGGACRRPAVLAPCENTRYHSMASLESSLYHRATIPAQHKYAELCEQGRNAFAVRYTMALPPIAKVSCPREWGLTSCKHSS